MMWQYVLDSTYTFAVSDLPPRKPDSFRRWYIEFIIWFWAYSFLLGRSLFLGLARKCVGRRQWHPTPVLLSGKSHWWRSLVGCSPWGRYESDTTEWLHFHFPLLCIGEGNGILLQCSCLENPRDGGAWWASVYGVAQSDLAVAARSVCVYVCVCVYGCR